MFSVVPSSIHHFVFGDQKHVFFTYAHLLVSKVNLLGITYIYIFIDSFIDNFISEGVILTCLLLFGSAGILKVWTGLIVSPFRSWIRIQDQIRIRIRLRDGYMEQEYGIIFSWERLPRIYVQVTPSSWKHYSDIL